MHSSVSAVHVYPQGGTKQTIVQDGKLCSSFEKIEQTVIDEEDFSRFIQMWRKRVNMRSRTDFEFKLPGLRLIGLMPESPMATEIEVVDPSTKELTFIRTLTEKIMATKGKTDKAPAKGAKGKKEAPAAEGTKKRGREPQIECEPGKTIKEPREGSMKARVLEVARSKKGTTIEDIEEMYEEEFEGKTMKTSPRIRAFEILKLLNTQNGFGFEIEKGKIFAIED